MVINDFLRGKLPWFTPPPALGEDEQSGPAMDCREGRLGEMRKRKVDAIENVGSAAGDVDDSRDDAGESSADEFESFANQVQDVEGDIDLGPGREDFSDSEASGGHDDGDDSSEISGIDDDFDDDDEEEDEVEDGSSEGEEASR